MTRYNFSRFLLLVFHRLTKRNFSQKTRFFSFDPSELCDRLKLLLQKKQAGNNSNEIDEESVATAKKFLEYNCISTEQYKFLLNKCLN